MSSQKSEWFTTWFDSPFYHLLYKNHDDNEAQEFLDALIVTLKLEKGRRVLDLGCGRGRHARYMSSKGFDVLGIDLSANSIEYAKNFDGLNLNFKVHDMREPIKGEKFDYVFNLFTSFGYFNSDDEDRAVFNAVKTQINTDGLFVIDYMNCNKAVQDLKSEETVESNNIQFNIARWVEGGKMHKKISVQGEQFHEEVKVLTLDDFKAYANNSGFTLNSVYGDYKLSTFDEIKSDRMIMVFHS